MRAPPARAVRVAPVIGHALLRASGPAALAGWDRWIAAGFAVGSACFFVGPFPGFVQLVGAGRRRGRLLRGLALLHARRRPRAARGDAAPRASAGARIRRGGARRSSSSGTLLFNLSTFDAMQTGLDARRRTGWSGRPTCSARPASSSPALLAYARRAAARAAAARPPGGWRRSTCSAACCSGSPRSRPTSCRRPGRSSTSPPPTGAPRSAPPASSPARSCCWPRSLTPARPKEVRP